MKRLLRHIQQRLSLRLGIIIVLIVTVAFTLLFGFLFSRGKHYIQRATIDHATQLLDNTAEQINGIMDETETVTNYMAQTTTALPAPAFVNKVLLGCSHIHHLQVVCGYFPASEA